VRQEFRSGRDGLPARVVSGDDLRAFAYLAEGLQDLGPDRLLTGISRARYRAAPELALPSSRSWSKAAVEGDVDQTRSELKGTQFLLSRPVEVT
jgi:hypothetical protein